MKIAIFADVHSNLEALDTMLSFCKSEKVQSYISAGDIVGYGPNPNECIDIFKQMNIESVLGNHDAACSGIKDILWFNPDAQRAILWSRVNLNEENRLYLLHLPKILVKGEITIAHGSPRDPLDEYLLTLQQLLENVGYFNTNVCCVGHSHFPFVFRYSEYGYELFTENLEEMSFTIDERYKYIVNVGSVGQPRDGDNRLCFCIYHLEKKELKFFRLEYDFQFTQEKMRQKRLPSFLIERLAWGR